MFAPPVAKPQAKADASSNNEWVLERSTPAGQFFGDGDAEHMRRLQRTIGNEAVLQLLEQRASRPAGNQPGLLSPAKIRMLQRSIGNEAVLRLLAAQRARVSGYKPAAQEKEADAAREAVPGVALDVSSIPAVAPDPTAQPEARSVLTAPPLPGAIQAKLVVGEVDDPLEHEADRIADQVMRMPAPGVSVAAAPPQLSRECAACEDEEKLQQKPAGPEAAAGEAPAIVHEVLRAPGEPLDPATRGFMEPRFGQDFSGVRVHSGTSAEQSARDVNAHAYTVGHNMVFGAGRFAPGTHEGQRLIAHELTHVVQQSGDIAAPATTLARQPDKTPVVKSDFEENVLRELHRLPAVEQEGISDLERNRRIGVLAARAQRLFALFSSLHGTEADAIYDRLRVRRAGDVLSERFHDILATATRKDLLESIGLKAFIASQIVPNASDFCRPFSQREIDQFLDFEIANSMYHFVNGDLRDFFGDEAADLYDTYLTSTAKNATPRIFDSPKSKLVDSFINHDATAKRQRELAAIIEKNLPDNCGHLPANEWIDFHLSAVIPREEFTAGFSFGGLTIPGIIAGGISSGGGSVDSRTLSIKQVLMRGSEMGGQTTGLRLRVQFHFVVKDAVDFCPGNKGSFFAQYFTIPLSRLEASGMAFSVPFEVRYDGPVLEVDLGPAAIDACKIEPRPNEPSPYERGVDFSRIPEQP